MINTLNEALSSQFLGPMLEGSWGSRTTTQCCVCTSRRVGAEGRALGEPKGTSPRGAPSLQRETVFTLERRRLSSPRTAATLSAVVTALRILIQEEKVGETSPSSDTQKASWSRPSLTEDCQQLTASSTLEEQRATVR